jgi:hypothetical protein
LDPSDYFTKNYVDLEEEVIDRKRAAEAAGIEDEWIISFKRTLEELAEWIEGLIKELFKDL